MERKKGERFSRLIDMSGEQLPFETIYI
jgi:hypothetical protein